MLSTLLEDKFMECDFRLYCRYCRVEITNRRGKSAYCSDECCRLWGRGYAKRKQAEHRADVARKLERLEELERLVASQ